MTRSAGAGLHSQGEEDPGQVGTLSVGREAKAEREGQRSARVQPAKSPLSGPQSPQQEAPDSGLAGGTP